MALNPTHSFEDLGDIKCAIVEKQCSPERVAFLKDLLEHNKYTVVVAPSPPAKGAAPLAEGETPPPPTHFTVGVTDVTFSPINAVYNRELRTRSGKIVTKEYWKQREAEPQKDEWYWSTRG
ncbi:MAG: hypothetical protein WC760_08245 [Bacteroidia bacterium]|jgi:hypothetical protein